MFVHRFTGFCLKGDDTVLMNRLLQILQHIQQLSYLEYEKYNNTLSPRTSQKCLFPHFLCFCLQFVRGPAGRWRGETFGGFSSKTSHQQLHEVRLICVSVVSEVENVWSGREWKRSFLFFCPSASVRTDWANGGCWMWSAHFAPAPVSLRWTSGESRYGNRTNL